MKGRGFAVGHFVEVSVLSSDHDPSDWNLFHVIQWPRLIAHPDEYGSGDPKQDEFI